MAREALTIIGTAVGSYFGQPGLGYTIGAAIGGAVDPLVSAIEGPRLNDLSIQTSTWGQMISMLYGTMRVAGNLIWSSGIRETANVAESDGKGGGQVTQTTTYSYAADFAIALCVGEILAVRRIWAYGNLIYNAGDNADIDTIIASQKAGLGFRIYTGSEEQLPDPTIEATEGAGSTPAYRGTAYAVFENFQLGPYGNRIPNLEFEVIKVGTQETGERAFPPVPYTLALPVDGVDFTAPALRADENPIVFTWSRRTEGSPIVTARFFYIHIYQLFQDSAVLLKTIEDPLVATNALGFAQFMQGTSDEPCAFARGIGDSSPTSFYFYRQTTYYRFYLPEALNPNYCKSGERLYVTPGTASASRLIWVYGLAGYSDEYPIETSEIQPYQYQAMCCVNDVLYCLAAGTAIKVVRVDATTLEYIGEEDFTGFTMSATVGFQVTDNGSIFLWRSGFGFYQLADGVATLVLPTTRTSPSSSRPNFGINNAGTVATLYPVTGTVDDPRGNTSLFFKPVESGVVTLDTIVEDQCARAGVTAVDVSELTAPVSGYLIRRQGSARTNLDQLQKAFYFDAVETDYKIKFPVRGSEPVLTVPYVELGAHEATTQAVEALAKTRAQEDDLPWRVSVNFINADGGYLVGSEHSQRLLTNSLQEVTLDLAIAMTPDKAAQISDVLLYDAYTSRTAVQFELTNKYIALDPGDVVVVPTRNADYTLRITSRENSGLTIKYAAVPEEATVYTSSAQGGTDQPPEEQIGVTGPTRVDYLDIPLVRDADDDPGFYAPMAGYRPAWRGATLFKSIDNTNFSAIGSVLHNATMGNAATKLGDWVGGNTFDETNTVSVVLTSGELESATEDEVLDGANIALIGNELVQFKNAVLTSPNTYLLSGFLRGRRGTEQHYALHAQGERFVLMTVAGTLRPNGGASEIGQPRFYKAVSIGQSLLDVPSQEFTNTAVGLEPYSVVHIGGGKQVNNDFIITWVRRTRVDGGWRNLVDVPLGEATEAYEVDILNGSTVVRTMSSSTPTVTYTAAMQTADFGSSQTNLNIVVYQLSATVGRGFPAAHSYP